MADNNNNKILNVPHLRFPEFSDEWEKCTLGDVTENFNLRNKEQIEYPMFSVTNDRGFVPQAEQFEGRDMVGEDIKAYKLINYGDFAYNPARINVGSIAMYKGSEPCMISSLYVCFKAKQQIEKEWLIHLLKTQRLNFYYNINGEGGVRIYLFYPNFARIRVSYPTLEEQRKVSVFLNLLEKRIATQTKIIEDLKKLKSALYHSIFSALDGKYISLGEIASIVKGSQVNGTELLDEGEYYVMNGGIQPSGYYDNFNAPANTISISEGGNSCGYVQYNTLPFWSGGHCYTIQQINNEIIPEFLYHYLKYKESEIMKLRIGSGLPNIQKKDLERFPIIKLPLQEQKRLLDFFNLLDNKESNETNLLSYWQKEKSYLLQQMFI